MQESGPGATTLTDVLDRLTLLSLVYLEDAEETPVHAETVTDMCQRQFESREVGATDEAVIRRLKRLVDTEYVDQTRIDDQSPVGKGNPAYRLAVDVETALEPFETERQVARVVESIESDDS